MKNLRNILIIILLIIAWGTLFYTIMIKAYKHGEMDGQNYGMSLMRPYISQSYAEGFAAPHHDYLLVVKSDGKFFYGNNWYFNENIIITNNITLFIRNNIVHIFVDQDTNGAVKYRDSHWIN